VRRTVLPLAGTEAGRAKLSVGAGGDTTMELDRAAEEVVFRELADVAASGRKFSVLSEETGHRSFGAEFPLVLVDPVDGSLNAEQGVPVFGVMLAVHDGPSVADAVAGYVLNLTNGEEWKAARGRGAWRQGRPLTAIKRGLPDRIQLLALESTPRNLQLARPLIERASKIRILGSMAISIALTGAGAFDVFCAPTPVRVFDMSASLLLLTETGGVATTIDGKSIADLRCDLKTRTNVLCGSSRELHAEALAILQAPR
jgi:myo-inositol-1(or 4)-monophosphatase